MFVCFEIEMAIGLISLILADRIDDFIGGFGELMKMMANYCLNPSWFYGIWRFDGRQSKR
jgi:hypothetical protein